MENLESKIEQKKSTRLKLAIREKNVEKVTELLREINKELTGAEYVALDQEELRDFIDGRSVSFKIYLGDGGMSRMIIFNEGGVIDISMSGNSSDEVVKKWEEM